MSATSQYEVIVAAVKKFREMIQKYQGAFEGLRTYLLRRLDKMETKANELLAGIIDETL
jgi:hypothetical protein